MKRTWPWRLFHYCNASVSDATNFFIMHINQ